MKEQLRQYVCLGVGAVLIVSGTIATGLVPPGVLYQILAGSLIVVGFAVSYKCFGGFKLLD